METNLIDITDAIPAQFAVTCADILDGLAEVGLKGRIDWECGGVGKVDVVGHPGAFIALDTWGAKVHAIVRSRYGHGNARLPTHPEYPAPISHPFVVSLLKAAAIANGEEE